MQSYETILNNSSMNEQHLRRKLGPTVVGVIPIAETFGFSNDIRAASQGRAVWNTENLGFEILPPQLFSKVVGEIRQRKGLKPEPNPESYYSD